MRRAWLFHSLKTVIVVLVTTFGTPYWDVKTNLATEPECHPINQNLLVNLGDTTKGIIVTLLITSVLLDFTCCWCPKFSATLLYLEVVWSVIDTIIVP